MIDEAFRFTRDLLFSSPSTAASIVRGANMNGRTAWKNSQGQTLAQAEETTLSE